MKIRRIIFWVVLLDQISKYLIVHLCHLGQSVTIFKNILYITYVLNPGAAFGFMAEMRALVRIPVFILITLFAALAVYSYQRMIPPAKQWQRFALGLIGGGALGNFVDRILYGQVVDFIDVEHINFHFTVNFGWFHFGPNFPWIFNVADSCITVGILLLILNYVFDRSAKPGVS